jgi:hypothetical protein
MEKKLIVFSKLKILKDKINDIDWRYNSLEKVFQAFKININNCEQLSLTNNISVNYKSVQSADEYKWKYVWSHSNGIYVGKSDGDSAIKIQTINDLKKLYIEGILIKLLSSSNNLLLNY